MVATYADRDNKNLARPVGIIPNVKAFDHFYGIDDNDRIYETHEIGDENEAMLKAALEAAGKKYTTIATTRSLDLKMPPFELKMLHNKYKFGKRIKQLPHLQKGEALK